MCKLHPFWRKATIDWRKATIWRKATFWLGGRLFLAYFTILLLLLLTYLLVSNMIKSSDFEQIYRGRLLEIGGRLHTFSPNIARKATISWRKASRVGGRLLFQVGGRLLGRIW